MKTYSILYAEDVPHYGCVEIQAESAAAALEAATACDLTEIALDPDHNWGTCRRIVAIEDEEGNTIAEDVPLDDCFLYSGGEKARRLCDAAPGMLDALRLVRDHLFDRGLEIPGYVSDSIAQAEGCAP